jgi:AcrR family transcriptional regulator
MERNKAGGIRARVRAEMISEIKAIARRHLATDGANLSLRAIARELGLVSSALYRYFASRDELLTALILDAYSELGEVAEGADAAIGDRADARGRLFSVSRAIRAWALANPAEYGLLYGTPVPGYVAPPDTTVQALRPSRVLGMIVALAPTAPGAAVPVSPALAAEIAGIRAYSSTPEVTDAVLVRGLIAWTLLFGALSFELFGRIDQTIAQRDEWFDVQMGAMADYIGLA